jgi:hypothetical protein
MEGKPVEVATTIEALEKENTYFAHKLKSPWWE